LRRISVDLAEPVYDPARLGEAIGSLLRHPPQVDVRHLAKPHVSLEGRLSHLRSLLGRRGSFTFDDAVKGADRLTEAVTLFALLELYKAGEAEWEQGEAFGPITVRAGGSP
jgi:segregation and condensation protein A